MGGEQPEEFYVFIIAVKDGFRRHSIPLRFPRMPLLFSIDPSQSILCSAAGACWTRCCISLARSLRVCTRSGRAACATRVVFARVRVPHPVRRSVRPRGSDDAEATTKFLAAHP